MRVYPDTSFMVSWLYPRDVHHGRARAWFMQHAAADWVVSPWTEFETINSLRQLCLRSPGPRPAQVEAARRLFKHLFNAGPLKRQAADWLEALADCHQISAAFGTRHKCRAADTLHIALLEQTNPDLFVSGDQDQVDLAAARGYQAVRFC
jgi:predicted nucleic acid-binding protein